MIYKTYSCLIDGPASFLSSIIASAKKDMEEVSLNGDIKRVYCTVENNSIRFRVDGVNPTSSVGHLVKKGESFCVDGANVERFRITYVHGGPVGQKPTLTSSYEV